MPQMKESQRLNYKAEIRNYLSLGLTPEAIARTLKQKHNLSRASTYNYLRDIRQEDSTLAESKDRRYIHSDISICRERLLNIFRLAVARIQNPQTDVFAVVSLMKLAQDIAITLLKLELEGVQVTEAMNSKIARAEPYLSSDDNSENHNSNSIISNSIMSNPHWKEEDVF
jgi:hypothetical protein